MYFVSSSCEEGLVEIDGLDSTVAGFVVTAGLRLNGIRDKKILKEIVEDSLKMAYLWDEVKGDLKKSVTALIGPSGCGKTTFLRCLNRMHDMTKNAVVTGKVMIDGIDLYDKSIDPIYHRRKVGMVFQKPNPFPTMSIYDNVTAGLKLNGVRNRQILDEIVEDTLKMAYLWDEVKDDLKKPAIELSGGQQQRLCIARALAIQPEVLLMDEPASALDPIATQKIEETIMELKKEFTIIIVTHNMQQAVRVSDYTGFMYLGDLIEFRETKKLFTDPKNELTAKYVEGRFG